MKIVEKYSNYVISTYYWIGSLECSKNDSHFYAIICLKSAIKNYGMIRII